MTALIHSPNALMTFLSICSALCYCCSPFTLCQGLRQRTLKNQPVTVHVPLSLVQSLQETGHRGTSGLTHRMLHPSVLPHSRKMTLCLHVCQHSPCPNNRNMTGYATRGG